MGTIDYSGLMPANLITFAHFSVSSAMSLPKSAGEPGIAVAPKSAKRVLGAGIDGVQAGPCSPPKSRNRAPVAIGAVFVPARARLTKNSRCRPPGMMLVLDVVMTIR